MTLDPSGKWWDKEIRIRVAGRGHREPAPPADTRDEADTEHPVVYVLDDDARVRRALGRLLRTAGHTVELFDSAEELLSSLPDDRPGCLVSDLRLPEVNGLDLFAMLRMAGHRLPIVFITGYGDVPTSVKAMKFGAVDFLTKPVDEHELLGAVGRALRRDARTRRLVAETQEARERFTLLTPREREVFALVVKGNLNKQIAGRLGTTEQTVKVHRGRVMQKMGVGSLAQLVHLSERLSERTDRLTDPPTERSGEA
jgi:FixJ family two-component response regulator